MDGKEVSIVSPDGEINEFIRVRRKEFIGVFLFLVTGCKGKRSAPPQRLAQFHRRLSIIEQAKLAPSQPFHPAGIRIGEFSCGKVPFGQRAVFSDAGIRAWKTRG